MSSPLPASPKIRFGAFELDAAGGKLLKRGIPIKLQPQPLRVLLLLTSRAGQVVTREEIQHCLWDESTFVDFERGINFSINQIRAILSDNPEKPCYIETLPRVGYRFIAIVSSEVLIEPANPDSGSLSSAGVYECPAESKTSTSLYPQTLSSPKTPAALWKRPYMLAASIAALLALATFGYSLQRWLSRSRISTHRTSR
jgi:DNA-binding winged helix-turn-helix (wHTH) protein